MLLQKTVCLLLALAAPCLCSFVLEPGPFLKLPDTRQGLALNNGAANKAAYDAQENLLYVTGRTADVLHVVDMADPSSPQLLDTKLFNYENIGLPNSLAVCRGGLNRDFLTISYESRTHQEKGHVHFYELLTPATAKLPMNQIKDVVPMDSFDPSSMAWDSGCSQLIVISEGEPHELNGVFEDPAADVEVLIPSFGSSVDRRSVPIVESKIAASGMRHVFEVCDTGATTVSSRVQDLEPKSVHVDSNNTAYILFSENNGIGKLDLNDPFAEMSYYSLGRKSWEGLSLDAAYEDNGINLENRTIESFYQPQDMVSFEVDGKMWLATADTGSVRQYNLRTCKFDESVEASSWNQQFSDGLTPAEVTKLRAEMSNNTLLGRLRVSKVRTSTDGWDPVYQGFDFVSTYGGRGFSILDPDDMTRVYDSGDDFERYYTTAAATQAEKAVFNAEVGSVGAPVSAGMDRSSPRMGPMPTAIAATNFSDSQVVVVANGVVGGLYTYSVSPGPVVNFEGFVRRGQPGLAWNEAYASNDDAVGEPYITDLLIIEDQGQKTVVAVSSYAASLSFYRLTEQP